MLPCQAPPPWTWLPRAIWPANFHGTRRQAHEQLRGPVDVDAELVVLEHYVNHVPLVRVDHPADPERRVTVGICTGMTHPHQQD